MDLLIEAVHKDIEEEKEIFRKDDITWPRKAFLASNTSTLSIAKMSVVNGRAKKSIGTHFLILATLSKLVEVVRAMETTDGGHDIIYAVR